ncbi:TonB-dependent receptor [Chryseobacterium indologenes]|uniref:TonB-dependent siderophore receptor n=1 Tax=Chryseobacterium indologenes TaxID=253 RepID=UPI000F4D4B76|nr:TonB-dependent receptor [Chryseobacterium indologenes]AYZ37915.1 TonB-dependent receptor [Chryseobacterium indologenes]MBF6646831.1 TonB-dependent receptor [Chryseobacterium indologenes]MBU3048254.1 TonB-dependent receptor [Chryseobacterium indologenes]MEB4763007.1 TonB-dependent receptor [Chryseobacterium indologenes]QQQ69515.1 TonB-dependent receptor [Chryseobacterium indologenes]
MKNVLICASMLGSMVTFAQKNDSANTKSIDEVVLINTYIKKDSEYSNKMPLKAIENPQVYSSIDKVILENQGLYTVDDALKNIPGLQPMWTSNGRAGDGGAYVSLRGFVSANSLRNGVLGAVTGTIDAINLEKVEVLKGPSGTLFGSLLSSYGGVINRVTKKPYEKFGGNISLAGGSYNTYRAAVDINTPLTQDKKLLFRLNSAYTNEGTFQSEGFRRNLAIAPSLSYKPNDRLSINLDMELFQMKNMTDQTFFFYSGKYLQKVNSIKDLNLDYRNSYLGKDLTNTGRSINFFGQVNYKISNSITSNTNFSTSSSYSNGFMPYLYFMGDSADNMYRSDQSTRDSRKRSLNFQQNFNGDFKIGNLRNRVVLGFDYLRVNNNQNFYDVNGFDKDEKGNSIPVPLHQPGFDYTNFNGTSLQSQYNALAGKESPYLIKGIQENYAVYLSNVLNITNNLNVLMALRVDNFTNKPESSGENKKLDQTFFSPKVGIVYELIKDKVSVFGNYQNSFKNLNYYLNASGATVTPVPEQANQMEGGIKTNLFNGKVSSTFSYYNIKVKDVLRNAIGAADPRAQVQDGTIISRGVELEINAYLLKGFTAIAGFSYNDSKYTQSDESVLNRRPNTAGSPYLANLYASYQFLDGKLKGLGFGIGGNYASENKIVNNFNTTDQTNEVFTLPSYVVLNASAYYDAKKFRIGVKVDNFTNQHYWIGYTTANPQRLINAVGTFTYKF